MSRQTKTERPPFGQWLNDARLEKGWTTQYLADMAGMDQGLVSKMENGRANGTYDSIVKLAAALGIHPGRGLRLALDPDGLISGDGIAADDPELSRLIAFYKAASERRRAAVIDLLEHEPAPRRDAPGVMSAEEMKEQPTQ